MIAYNIIEKFIVYGYCGMGSLINEVLNLNASITGSKPGAEFLTLLSLELI